MGYRSQGYLWMPKETQNKLSVKLQINLKEWEHPQENMWFFDSWKWYSGYDDVKIWLEFFQQCQNDNLEYEFARIGEDYEDFEIEGSEPYSKFYLNRDIGYT